MVEEHVRRPLCGAQESVAIHFAIVFRADFNRKPDHAPLAQPNDPAR